MISAFDTTAKVDAAFAELKAYWDRLLDIYVVKTDEEKLDRMVNIWNQYQCMITFTCPVPPLSSRAASVVEWVSATPTRTSWASCIRYRNEPANESST